MNQTEITSFPPEVAAILKYYVYRLIDPRNGETFYVGKGQGNRVFAHIAAEQKKLEGDGLMDNKLQRIHAIHLAGFKVAHVIHRHGMDEETAFAVEAALIEAYPGLANIVGGVGSNENGVMHADQIIRRYSAEEAKFQHNELLILVPGSALERTLYEATRYAWVINKFRAEKAEVILAVVHGLIMGAFVAKKWMEATPANFPGREEAPGRFGFEGEEAPDNIKKLYVGKRVPDEYCKKGAANPIKYTY